MGNFIGVWADLSVKGCDLCVYGSWLGNVFTKSVVSSAIYEQTIFFLNGDRNLFERL